MPITTRPGAAWQSDAALMALAPANPPSAGKAFDPIRDTNVSWKTPSKTAEDAMPIGNGKVLASIWTNPDGDIRVSIARIPKPGAKAEPLGEARFRLSPGSRLLFTWKQRMGSVR